MDHKISSVPVRLNTHKNSLVALEPISIHKDPAAHQHKSGHIATY